MTTYYDYLGRPMAVSADPTQFLSGSSDGHETLTAPAGPSGVTVNGGNYDTLIGSDGDNIFYVNNSTDVVQVGSGLSGVKTIVSYAGGYILPDNVQNLTFYGAGDWGVGNALGNLIVMGGNDQNYMDGGAGNDVMVGGFGKNTFGVETGNGNDVIYNFHAGVDNVRIAGASFTSFAQIQAAMTQAGADVVLQIDPTETLTFRGVNIADFRASNFLMPLDASKLGALTFDDEFNSLSLATGGASGNWHTNFGGDPTKLDTYAITSNDEKQVYTDSTFAGTAGHPLGYNPFSLDNGVLNITAERFSYADSQYTFGQAFSSGMLDSQGLFMQKYGYFEMKAELPTALGTWPAFWLSQDPYKPGVEADVLEHLAMYPDAVFSRSNDAGSVTGATYSLPNASGFHTYGMMWGPVDTTFYVDGQAVMQVATPASWDKPMYMMLNLALGGWGGQIDDAGLPAQMKVDYVRVYGLADSPVEVSSGQSTYAAADGIKVINLIGSAQTVTGNAAGDTFNANDTGNHLIGGAGADTFNMGGGGDVVTGGAGADTFAFSSQAPTAAGHITDFTLGQDVIDLTPFLTKAGYTGANPAADGYLKIGNDGSGNAQIWVKAAPAASGSAWSLAITVDGVNAGSLMPQGDTIVGAQNLGVSVSDAVYTAPYGVSTITLTGSGQTITANSAGDVINSNGAGNALMGGAGADTFNIGAGGDVVTGAGGADRFAFAAMPALAAHITDFTSGQDSLDLSGLLAHIGYAGSNPVGAGYVKITTDAAGNGQVWANAHPATTASAWTLVATLDGVSASGVQMSGSVISGGAGAPPAGHAMLGSSASEAVYGGGGADHVYGLGGNDSLYGGGGAVSLYGGAGNDILVAGSGSFVAYGGTGNDYFYGGSGADVAYAFGSGVDVFVMGAGDDTAYGAGGTNYMYGGGGNDHLYGGSGVNVIIAGDTGSSTIYGNGTQNYVYGGNGDNTIYGGTGTGNDVFVVGSGNDVMYGGAGLNYFYGGSGTDTYHGGAGTDVMISGNGTNTYYGGGGVDYMFLGSGLDTVIADAAVAGVAVIHDFDVAKDVIRLQNTGWSSLADVNAHTYDYMASGGFTVITFSDHSSIWLIGVDPGHLTSQDFLFG